MKVRDIMTSEVVTASPDTTLEEIATMMKSGDTGAIPVVEEGELLGIITDRDIVIRCVAQGKDPSEVTADDILTDELEVVGPDADFEEALDIMGRSQIRRLPVVDNGELVGMISIGDMAVKQDDEQETGQTLKDVSQGVKSSRRPPQPAVRTTSAASRNTGSKSPAKTKQSSEEDTRRQGRVVSIRPEANEPPRGQKKPTKPKAS